MGACAGARELTEGHYAVNPNGDDASLTWRIDEFASRILQRKVARLEVNSGTAPAIQHMIDDVLASMRASKVNLVVCRIPEIDTGTGLVLQSSGFSIVECLLSLSTPLAPAAPRSVKEFARVTPEEAAACGEIARMTFAHDRFHVDPEIPDRLASELKYQWASNACKGRSDVVFAAHETGELVGFNACLLRGTTAVIDLIGVAPGARGQGLARRLVEAALDYYGGRATQLQVGTQSRNFGSLALYQRCGFRVTNSYFTFHLHQSA